jgi:ketosteroid isomerase-like protein
MNSVTDQLTEVIQSRVSALDAKDAAILLEHYADDVMLFDAIGPLRARGAGVEAARLKTWFGAYESPISCEIRELEVVAGAEVAFAHYLYRIGGIMTDGTKVGMWLRATVGFRQVAGEWKIVHEHDSVPFDGETTTALVTLTP